jgi:predicted RNA-binding Zn ribbon-like protein
MGMSPTSWPSDEEQKPAPPELLPVQRLVNSRDVERGTDLLEEPEQARRWLADAGLIARGERPSTADLRLTRAVRESLRAMLAANSGDRRPSRSELEPVDRLIQSEAPSLELGRGGRLVLAPRGSGVRAGLLGLLLRVRDAQLDGSWASLKLCANPDCRWAFYDRSRNHQGTWCRMEVCGNRLKNRRLRARRR